MSGYRTSSQVFGAGAFSLYDHLIHGELDLASQRCTIRVEMDLIAGRMLFPLPGSLSEICGIKWPDHAMAVVVQTLSWSMDAVWSMDACGS